MKKIKLPVPHDLTLAQAQAALDFLELFIDALIEYYTELRATYNIWNHDDELPF